ncbi:hypothetical protein ACFCYM_30570 [Streptomyces sp. NPDC056254]|uniref:hypothetical protein n=1 Tax=Streptomyces sp. NPDC056254 TaxID=3345763 RepID=UPI0035DD2767
MPVTRRRFAALLTVLTAGTTGVLSILSVASGRQTSGGAAPGKNPAAVQPASVTSGSVVQVVVRTAVVTAGPAARPHVSAVTEAGGRAGYGAVGAAGRHVAGRADSGTVSTSGLGGPPAWAESGMLFTGAPAAVAEPGGTTTTAVLGLDAELHTSLTPATPARPAWHRAVR